MRLAIRTVCVLFLLPPLFASAESACTYCGSWVPTGALFEANYKRGEVVAVAETSISVPLCSPMTVERVYFTETIRSYRPPPEATLKPVTAVFRATQSPSCNTSFAGLKDGVTIKVELRPRGNEGWEELVIAIYPLSVITDVIQGGEILEYLPVLPGKKQRVRRHPSPTPVAEWWFVREGHNPCDEGNARGESLCSGWASNISLVPTVRLRRSAAQLSRYTQEWGQIYFRLQHRIGIDNSSPSHS